MGFIGTLLSFFKTKQEDTCKYDTIEKWKQIEERKIQSIKEEFPFLNNNPFDRHDMSDMELKRMANIINESDTIIKTSKNYDTKTSRIDLCVKFLYEICACFPDNRDYAESLGCALELQPKLYNDSFQSKISTNMGKARAAKTLSAKISYATKSIEEANSFRSCGFVAIENINVVIAAVQDFINNETLADILLKAERFEFKGNAKKASDAYMDALFFIKKADASIGWKEENGARVKAGIDKLRSPSEASSGETTADASPLPGQAKASAHSETETPWAAPIVDGCPVFEYAETAKDDIEMMKKCCEATMADSIKTGMEPAPFYFWRVAVLAKKAKDYALEVSICERYLAAADEYLERKVKEGFVPGVSCPNVAAGPRYLDMRKRLPKARANLAKQQTASVKGGKLDS